MKTHWIPRLTLAIATICAIPLLAQNDPADLAPALERQAQQLAKEAQQRHRDIEVQVRALADSQIELAQASAGLARQQEDLDVLTTTQTAGPQTGVRLERIVKRISRGTAQPLIVTSTALEPTQLAELREDLSVMNKLIEDAAADEGEAGNRRAMGIAVTSFWSGDAGARTLYIAGYGAIFQTTVRFPLKATAKPEATAAKPAAKKSAWEDARRELYGGPEEASAAAKGSAGDEAEDYSEERVESLKKALIKALGSASNIRQLGRDETVTVVVCSGGSQRSGHSREIQQIMGNLNIVSLGESAGAPSSKPTMTLRVKKADADALSEGKLNEEEFGKRTMVAIY